MAEVVAIRNPRARALGRYPSCWTASITRSRVASVILRVTSALRTRDTTLGSTPATAATSRRVGARVLPPECRAGLTRLEDDGAALRPACARSPRHGLSHQRALRVLGDEPLRGRGVDGAASRQPRQEVLDEAGIAAPTVGGQEVAEA